LLPFDFRGDIDLMEELKALPISPVRLALGQLLTPTLVATSGQALAMLAVVLGLAAGSGLAVGSGALVFSPAGRSRAAAMVVAWVTLSAGAMAPVPMVGRAFVGFDVARDVPA